MKMKLATVTLSAALALEAVSARAGNVNLLGNLNVNSNLTAQSIGLAGVTQTNWNFLPLQGAKYVIVAEGTNDLQRGSNLLAAYATATTLNPSSSNRVVVLVPPGSYNTGLTMNTSYVDLIGLVPAQMTTKQVFTDSWGNQHTKTVADVHCSVRISGGISQNVDDIRIESVVLTGGYWPYVSGTNTVLRHVEALSMPTDYGFLGQYIDCVGGNNCFGSGTSYQPRTGASGTFIDCVAGDHSFGGDADGGQGDGGGSGGGTASGTFIGCTGGFYSFGVANTISGVFIGCVTGDESFGGEGGNASGTFINCVGGNACFGSSVYPEPTGVASGTFLHCWGGQDSFGGGGGTASGKFTDCTGGWESFGGDGVASGTFLDCWGDWGCFGAWGTASGQFTDCTGSWYSFAGNGGNASGTFLRCSGNWSFGNYGTCSGTFIECSDASNGFGVWGTLATTAKLYHCVAGDSSFGSFAMPSDDFNYNVGGTNTFLMLPNLPTRTNGLASGTVYNSSGALKVMP